MPILVGGSSGVPWVWVVEATYLLPAGLAALLIAICCGTFSPLYRLFSGSNHLPLIRDMALMVPVIVGAHAFLASLDRFSRLQPSRPQELLLPGAFLIAGVTAYLSCLLLLFAYLVARRTARISKLAAEGGRPLFPTLAMILAIPAGVAALQSACFGVVPLPGDAFLSRQLGYSTSLVRQALLLSDLFEATLFVGLALVGVSIWGLLSGTPRPAMIATASTYAFSALGGLTALDVYSSFYAHLEPAPSHALALPLALFCTTILATAYCLLVARALIWARYLTRAVEHKC